MTILSTVQHVSSLINLNVPTSVVGSSDAQVVTMLELANEEGRFLRDSHEWAQLSREYTFTLSSGDESYALPADFDKLLYRTTWDRSQHWEIRGPLTPDEWQYRKSGIVAQGPREHFRNKGSTLKQFHISPTPGSGDSGRTIAYEYQSTNWVRPKIWTASTSWTGIQYCFYNGNYYDRGGTGAATTGTTAPTHTTGAVSDGSITWTYYAGIYDSYLHDTDTSLIPERLISLGVQYRMLRQRGLEYQAIEKEYEVSVMREAIKLTSAPTLSVARPSYSFLLNRLSIPETGYGS